MSIEEAIRILHPDTTREALAEIEYYHGFKGTEYAQAAVNQACEIACDIMRKVVVGELIPSNHKHDGKTSDGYHTFDELYHHRAVLFATVVADHPRMSWKSKLHHDGTMYDGMFIVGLDTPYGQASYHYDIDPYWDMFHCVARERAPEWDGHTPDQALERIYKIRGNDLLKPRWMSGIRKPVSFDIPVFKATQEYIDQELLKMIAQHTLEELCAQGLFRWDPEKCKETTEMILKEAEEQWGKNRSIE